MSRDGADPGPGAGGEQPAFEDWSGRAFSNMNLSNTTWRETVLVDARFSGLIDGLVINDVEVAPLIVAELDRRHPERLRLRPRSVEEAGDAWTVIEGLWEATKARAEVLDEAVLHEQVGGEWSCAETFRHLVLVTDLWIGQHGLGREDFHPLGLPPSFMPPAAFGLTPAAHSPTWAEVVAAREDRMGFAKRHLGDVDLHCVRTVLDEEWHHNWFANRDLDHLAASASGR